MKHLLVFNLKNHFFNKATIVINILLFIAIYVFFHIDDIYDEPIGNNLIYVDSSLQKYYSQLEQYNNENYQYSLNSESNIKLTYQDQYLLESSYQLDERLIIDITNNLREVLKDQYLISHPIIEYYLKEYQDIELVNVVDIIEDNQDNLWLLASIIYTVVISYASLIANNLLYEKSINVLPLLLTNCSGSDHLISKIIEGYLTPVVQLLLIGIYAIINYVIRYYQDYCKGLKEFLRQYQLNSQGITGEIELRDLFWIFIIILLGLMILQIIMLLIASRFKNSQQAASFQGLLTIVMLLIFLLIISCFNKDVLEIDFMNFLSLMPLFSIILLPSKIIMNNYIYSEIIIAVILDALTISLLITYGSINYKNNLFR